MRKIIFYLLLLLNFLLPLAITSNTFDADLGWHLRFGQELHNNTFPYLDTYTYSKFGFPWTNHEWGGDWLLWLIYSKLGYWWLNLLMATAIITSFLIIGKTFYKKINSTFLITALVCQWSITHIFVTRLAMFTPLFTALTFYVVEKSKINRHWLYVIPPMFWLWSVLHGSWILGFIILNIYLATALLIQIIPKKYSGYINETRLATDLIYKLLLIQLTSAILITINPYGIKIWQEIIEYFGQNYYKMHVNEWVPSYVFPIFWKILIIQTIALIFVIYGFIKKKLSFTHLMIFLTFYYAAIAYKRQAVFMGLLSAVVLAIVIELAQIEMTKIKILNDNFVKKSFLFFSTTALILLSFYYFINIHFTNDVWSDKYLIEKNNFPFEAISWLKANDMQSIKIFNAFDYGGYLNWTMPNALIYFDGRGTATWMYNKNKTMLEHQFEILYDPNGLNEIERDQANYIFLRRTNYIPMAKPDAVNNWLFGKESPLTYLLKPTQLEIDLTSSNNWKKIYSDRQINIWKYLNHEPK